MKKTQPNAMEYMKESLLKLMLWVITISAILAEAGDIFPGNVLQEEKEKEETLVEKAGEAFSKEEAKAIKETKDELERL